MSIVIGIDYSVNCPSICIHKGTDIRWWVNYRKVGTDYPPLISRPPFVQPHPDTPQEVPMVFWTRSTTKDEIDRFVELRDWVIRTIGSNVTIVPDKIVIEDYSFGAKGNSLTHLAENMGILKAGLRSAFPVYTQISVLAPTTIKKFATGSGKADKDDMWKAFVSDFPEYKKWQLLCHPKAEKVGSPCADIADSYFLAKYMLKPSPLAI